MGVTCGLCAFTVSSQYKVNRDPETLHCIDVQEQWCSCGQWQEHGVPCVDACAYFRHIRNQKEDDVLRDYVPQQFKFLYHQELMKSNIKPVIIDTLRKDGITRPPPATGKRTSGRPKKKRLRRRSKFTTTEESTISCGKCGQRGHNARTCAARQAQEAASLNDFM